MIVELLTSTRDPELIIASAGKLCYSPSSIKDLMDKQSPEMVDKFINMLNSMGHESPLEHASFSFGIEGVSRITEIQLVRHRIASYSIQSGRYVQRENPEFIKPEMIKANEEASKVFDKIAESSAHAYNELFLILMLEQMGIKDTLTFDEKADIVASFHETDLKKYKAFEKVAIENARYVHLQSIGVKIVATMNLRSLINFTRHRECRRAQEEIRILASEMKKCVEKSSPTLGKLLGAPCRFGSCPEGKMSCGIPFGKA